MRTHSVFRIYTITAMLFFVAIVILALSGCGISLVLKLDAPTNLSATTDQVNQITISWAAVKNASHYYVYRAEESDTTLGPGSGTLYLTVEHAGFIDIDVPNAEYYYAVSAGDAFDRIESQLSETVLGTAFVPPPQWRLPLLVGVGTNLVDLAVDTSIDEQPTYILTVPTQIGAALTVNRIIDDTTLEIVGQPFGAVNGTVKGSAALTTAGGTLFVASTDVSDASDLVSEVIMWRFDSDTGTWTAESVSTSLTNAETSAPWIDIEARSPNDVFLAYRSEGTPLNGPIAAYRYNGTTITNMAAALVAGGTDRVTSVRLSIASTTETLLYKKIIPLAEGELYVAQLVGGVWDNPTLISDALDVIPDGYLDATHDPITNDLYVAYYDATDSRLEVKKNNAASPLAPTLGAAAVGTETIALTANNGEVLVFYAEPSGDGVIRKFTGTEWETLSPDPLTLGGSLSSLEMWATTDRVVIGYVEATVGMIRRYY